MATNVFKRFRPKSTTFFRSGTSRTEVTLASEEDGDDESDGLSGDGIVPADKAVRTRSTPVRMPSRLESGLKALRRGLTRNTNTGSQLEDSETPVRSTSSKDGIDSPGAAAYSGSEPPPWQELRTSQTVASMMKDVLARIERLGDACTGEEGQRQLQRFRDAVAAETWSLAEKSLARERRRAEQELALGRRSQSQGKDLQASAVRELSELRQRVRSLPEGTKGVVNVQLCEPLQHVDEGTRNLVEVIVKDKLEDIISRSMEGADSELLLMLRERASKDVEGVQTHARELEERVAQLQGRADELERQEAAQRKALESARTEATVARADESVAAGLLKEERSRRLDLERQLAIARREAEELRAGEAREEAERRRREAVEGAEGGSTEEPPERAPQRSATGRSSASAGPAPPRRPVEAPPSPRPAEGRERRPALPGATAVCLLERAADVHARLKALGREPKSRAEASAVAQDLLHILRQFAAQLDGEVQDDAFAAGAVGGALELLSLRVGLAQQETDAVWECCLSLWCAMEEVADAATAQGAPVMKLANVTRRSTEAIGAAQSCLSQCLSAASDSHSKLEGPRQKLQDTHLGHAVTARTKSPLPESTSKGVELPPLPLSTPSHAASCKPDDEGDAEGGPMLPCRSLPASKVKAHSERRRSLPANTNGGPLGLSGGSIMRNVTPRSVAAAHNNDPLTLPDTGGKASGTRGTGQNQKSQRRQSACS